MMQVIDFIFSLLSFEGLLLHLQSVCGCTESINSVLVRSKHLGQ